METDTDKMDSTNHHRKSIRCKFRDSIRKSLSVQRTILVDFFDTFKWFLTLIMLYVFFSYIVKLPILFLGVINPLYAYLWIALWILVMSFFLAWREVEHTKAQMSPKWFYNPNAVNEYVEFMEKSSKD